MILEDVKLREQDQDDEKTPYYYRTRIVDITTDKGTFSTPTRVIARSEYLARSNLPLAKPLPTDLAIDFRNLSEKQTKGLLTEGKVAEKILRVTQQFNDISRRAIFRISVFQPPKTILGDWSSKQKIEFADTQANYLQKKLGTNLITFPYLALPTSEYIQFINARYRRDQDLSTIFTLDLSMDYNSLKEILEHLKAKKDPMIIALIYEEWQKTIPQHNLIASYFDNEKMAFFACQVEREELDSHTSNLHAVACGGGFDLVSLIQKRGYSDNKNLDMTKINIYDPNTLSINNIEAVANDPSRDLVEEFDLNSYDYNDQPYLSSIVKGYKGAGIHPKKYQILYYLAKVHEAVTSPPRFDKERKMIKSKEFLQHISDTKLKEVPMIRSKQFHNL